MQFFLRRLLFVLVSVAGFAFLSSTASVAQTASTSCGPDQTLVNGACWCKVDAYVIDPATGICGCPSGQSPVTRDGVLSCAAACPSGQERGPNASCQTACPADQMLANGACHCTVEAYVPDPATGICGCPSGQSPVRDGSHLECAANCPAGQERGPNGSCQTACPADQMLANGACHCTVEAYVPDPATGICGCPSGQSPLRDGNILKCVPACPAGQERGPTGVCQNACAADQMLVNGACRCTVEAYVADPATGVCGCPSGDTPVRDGNTLKCVPSCPAGQERGPTGVCQTACAADQTLVNGACRCTVEAYVADPATGVCGCPAGKSPSRDGNTLTCAPSCPAGQAPGPDGSCQTACPGDQTPVNGTCRCTVEAYVVDPATGACGCPAGTIAAPPGSPSACVNACPAGTSLDANGQCVPSIRRSPCRVGLFLSGRLCVAACPRGQGPDAAGICRTLAPGSTPPPASAAPSYRCPSGQPPLADGSCPPAVQLKLNLGRFLSCPGGQAHLADGSCPAANSNPVYKSKCPPGQTPAKFGGCITPSGPADTGSPNLMGKIFKRFLPGGSGTIR